MNNFEWIPLSPDSPDNDDRLEDHFFYLVADKRYGTPMKAKYHDEGYFQILSQYHYSTQNADVWSWEFGDVITHYMQLPELPWKYEKEAQNDTSN